MLAWIIAAASLCCGLTPTEVDAVATEVNTRLGDTAPSTMTPSDALTMLDTAIATVLAQSRH